MWERKCMLFHRVQMFMKLKAVIWKCSTFLLQFLVKFLIIEFTFSWNTGLYTLNIFLHVLKRAAEILESHLLKIMYKKCMLVIVIQEPFKSEVVDSFSTETWRNMGKVQDFGGFLLKIVYWSIVYLQYCIHFRCIIYTPLKITIEQWLYFTVPYAISLFLIYLVSRSLYLLIPYPISPLLPFLPPLVITRLFST